MVEGRTFTGIGKILIDTPGEDWNIPNLHFLVSRSGENIYEAVNLEFGLVSTGKSGSDSARRLVEHTCGYLMSVINEGNGYRELREIVRKDFMSDYWAEYRGIEFDFAEKGDDLSHDLDKRINKAIQESFNEELKKAIEQGAERVAAEILSRLTTVRATVVEYKEISERRAA
jgi:hypothetical protein